MNGIVETLRGPVGLVALIAFGLAVLAAEAWLITTGTSLLLVAVLMASTLGTLYMLGQAAWEEWR